MSIQYIPRTPRSIPPLILDLFPVPSTSSHQAQSKAIPEKSPQSHTPKILKSASITLRKYVPESLHPQYLLCREIRNGHLVLHPIGGKVEPTDRDILETACREFVEETRLLSIPKFSELFPEASINKSAAVEWLYQTITQYFQEPAYYDYPVSKEKNYYHRFYIIDLCHISLVSIKEFLENIGEFYKMIDSSTTKEKDAGKISELVWDSWIASPRLKRSKYSTLSLFLTSFLHPSK